ncbi:unnamed protein product [Vitrella brassicaformis CCMP3155]|uniref:Small RNA 2'-O-methyltransferase n=1 Tax=Vitrella brassicaformis (strain CCMP3155) TaxID=1169540 RepID=A0A0G4ET42_VITBC|nr:unnamed protein product [Vitrella brassicaformis CCMP3155]|eukprot:CEM01591.1 unnamed protein product [Vitrella brassicaformis CCMP3155]
MDVATTAPGPSRKSDPLHPGGPPARGSDAADKAGALLIDGIDKSISELTLEEGSGSPSKGGKGGVKFSSPVWLQRMRLAIDLLEACGAHKVVDLGCGEGKLLGRIGLNNALDTDSVLVVGVDTDENALFDSDRWCVAPFGRHLCVAWRRDFPLRLKLLKGDILRVPLEYKGWPDAVTLIEVIEHLQPADLPALSKSIFGDLCPAMCLVTTPNKDFNPLFSDKPTFVRHSDHKFEWTRQEFQEWCLSVCKSYPNYDVFFVGVGSPTPAHPTPPSLLPPPPPPSPSPSPSPSHTNTNTPTFIYTNPTTLSHSRHGKPFGIVRLLPPDSYIDASGKATAAATSSVLGVPYTTECAPDAAAWAMSQAYGCCTQCAVFRRKDDGGAAIGAGGGGGGGEVAGWKDFDGFWWPSVRDEGYDRTSRIVGLVQRFAQPPMEPYGRPTDEELEVEAEAIPDQTLDLTDVWQEDTESAKELRRLCLNDQQTLLQVLSDDHHFSFADPSQPSLVTVSFTPPPSIHSDTEPEDEMDDDTIDQAMAIDGEEDGKQEQESGGWGGWGGWGDDVEHQDHHQQQQEQQGRAVVAMDWEDDEEAW